MLHPAIFFKCLSDETRLRCMLLLHKEGELCVCELTYALGLSQPKISRHLALLKQHSLLNDCRKGQWVYYRINSTLPKWVRTILNETTSVTEENSLYQQDTLRLKSMNDRPIEVNSC